MHGSIDPVVLVVTVAAWLFIAGSCIRHWARVRGTESAVPGWRLAAFLTGLGLVWLTILPPLATLDHQLLTAHMLKHLILMTLAAPLLLLGHSIPRLGRGVSREPASGTLGRLATHPVLCWLAGTVTVLVWHVPSVLSLAMHSGWMHLAQTLSFLGGGVLFWLPVIRPWSSLTPWSAWSVPLYLLLATLPCDALSAFLAFCGRPVYASALSAAPPEQLLADQQRAGALMWVWVTLVYLVPAVWQVLRLLASPGSRSSPAAGAH